MCSFRLCQRYIKRTGGCRSRKPVHCAADGTPTRREPVTAAVRTDCATSGERTSQDLFFAGNAAGRVTTKERAMTTTTQKYSDLMTREEASTYVRRGRITILHWAKDHRFVQPVRNGRGYMFRRDDVVTFFRAQADGYAAQRVLRQ
jgi:hypothetical protein